eukprot:TRINITY_DN13169_c4_g1_i1.p2 TRINITY_DN13169_c4_g1~~TRINITY_DN13169_c4_g1_i1.p2  ORF type:complete len:531 (+),score=209.24 TRINITY_DN13169_c4_g1_i1:93-1595(+)
MEEFKDVMLSEPPPARAGEGGHRSFENFKGILLCDRPTDHRMVHGVAEQPFLPPGRPDRDLFGMPGQGEMEGCLGLQPSQERAQRHDVARQARLENSKNVPPTALSKHRKWLKSLSEETKKLKLDAVETQLLREEKQKRFQDAERKKRKMIQSERAVNDLDGPAAGRVLLAGKPDPYALVDDSGSEPRSPAAAEDPVLPPTPPGPESGGADGPGSLPDLDSRAAAVGAAAATPAADAASQQSRSEPKSKKRKGKEKPKWAMTAKEAEEAEENRFDEEMHAGQDLVDFFINLDIEKVIDDPEVRESLSIALERVEEIAAEQGLSPADFRRAADGGTFVAGHHRRADDDVSVATSQCSDRSAALERKRQREKRRRDALTDHQQVGEKDWDSSSTAGDKVRQAIGGDALRLAEQVLAKSEGLRQVHSRQSLARILEELVLKKFAAGQAVKTVPPAPAVPEPVVADTRAQAMGSPQKERRIITDLRNSKEFVQNLPYLYRCPSI